MLTAIVAEIDESYHVMVMGEDGCFRKIPDNNGWRSREWADAELSARQTSNDFTTPTLHIETKSGCANRRSFYVVD